PHQGSAVRAPRPAITAPTSAPGPRRWRGTRPQGRCQPGPGRRGRCPSTRRRWGRLVGVARWLVVLATPGNRSSVRRSWARTPRRPGSVFVDLRDAADVPFVGGFTVRLLSAPLIRHAASGQFSLFSAHLFVIGLQRLIRWPDATDFWIDPRVKTRVLLVQ